MNQNDISSNNRIEVLSDLEAVQTRPNMYLGTLYDATQLLVEILDNSLDELANNFTNEVVVNIYPDHSVMVSDWGRGIPIHNVNVNGVLTDSIVTSATKLHSGGKFNNATANYKITIGLHGVGLVAVNAICEYMVIKVAKDKKLFTYNFSYGKFINKTERPRKAEDASTTVTFKPVAKYFNKIGYNSLLIQKRLYLIAAHIPSSKIHLNDQLIPSIPMKDLAKTYLGVDESHQIFELTVRDGDEKARIFITYDNEKCAFGDVNLNICGGGYLTAFETIFANIATIKYPNLTKNNVLSNFKFYCSLSIKEPRFDAQTKGRMVKDTRSLLRQVIPSLERILDIPFFKEYLKDLSDSKILNSASKKLKRKTIVSAENPLQDCRNRPGDILYILEGDSAGGTLKKFRDKNTEAIFPLSGKILNTTKKNIDKALESNKVKFLLEAIGVDPTGRRKDFRYNTIKVISDADCLGPNNTVQFIKDGKLITGPISEMGDKWKGGMIPSLNVTTNQIELKPIIGFLKKPSNGRRMMDISTRANHCSTFTEDHEMFVTSSQKGVQKIPLKDINPHIHRLIRSDMDLLNVKAIAGYSTLPISYIEDADQCEYIYCFEVEDNHNFACGTDNIIVSNCDGAHITVLVTIAIWRYAKHIIEDSSLVIIMPPLYGTRIKGEFIPIYSQEEMEVYRSQNYEISRFKGLGEMDSEDLEAVIRGNSREYIVRVPGTKELENAIKLVMVDTDVKRQLCNDNRYGLETVLNAALKQSTI